MPTEKQKKLAKALIDNAVSKETKTAKEILVNIGYSLNTAEAIPGEIISAEGVQEAMANLGFTEEKAKEVVGKILQTGSDKDKLKAADLVFKVKGSYAPEKHEVTEKPSHIEPEVLAKVEEVIRKEMLGEE